MYSVNVSPAQDAINQQGLAAQAALLPYALLAFGLSLPVFVWAGSHAANAAWMSLSFVLFAGAWGCVYAIVGWLKTAAAECLPRRARVQLLGGLIWAGAIGQTAIFAEGAGPAREVLLMLSLAGGVITVVFAAPWLPSLLLVAPAALAAPLVCLFNPAGDGTLARLSLAGAALALALGLMVNRILRAQFALAAEREQLIRQAEAQTAAAQRLARSKSDLVATLSDEIRTGLTGVAHVLASAAGRGGRVAPSREQLNAALDAVTDLQAVLETTVDAEILEAGRLVIEPRPFDLSDLVRDVVQQHRPQASARGLEIAVHIDPDLRSGATIGDPARVRQILGALVGNAVKFTVRGRIEARLQHPGDGQISVAVADTGPGLSEAELAQALTPFQRVARTCAGSPGAGLGLPLAAQLARLMDGELRADSAPGLGSCFTVTLPFDAQRAAPPRNLTTASHERSLRILLVETEALSAAMLRACLEQLGHNVLHAADGARAVELAQVCDLDLAMVAASGPAAEGSRILAELRSLAGARGATPTVALIGGDAEEASECLAAGADALLRKPVAIAACARAIAEALAARRSPAERAVA